VTATDTLAMILVGATSSYRVNDDWEGGESELVLLGCLKSRNTCSNVMLR